MACFAESYMPYIFIDALLVASSRSGLTNGVDCFPWEGLINSGLNVKSGNCSYANIDNVEV